MKPEVLGWRPGLDGLRGVAILMVMLFHFEATHELFPGGSLGVDIFFVLSGFLITTLLLEERSRTGGISLPHFFQRRARRLLPALAAFLAIFAVITIVSTQPGVSGLPATLFASLFYVFNWVLALGETGTGGAGHLWSLSVEEQFYLLWPFAVIVAMRRGPRALLVVSLLLFCVSASLPAWTGRSYEGLYYATDFRAQALMAGAILALLRSMGVVTASIGNRTAFRAALVLSTTVLCLFLLAMADRVQFLDAGMYTVVAVASAILICAALNAPPRILTNRAMRYVGTRSYALYLWHNAIAYWMRDLNAIPALVISVVLSFAAAELSWQLVERRGSFAAGFVNRVRERFSATGAESAEARPSVPVHRRPATSESQR